jgi:hypothetical protein
MWLLYVCLGIAGVGVAVIFHLMMESPPTPSKTTFPNVRNYPRLIKFIIVNTLFTISIFVIPSFNVVILGHLVSWPELTLVPLIYDIVAICHQEGSSMENMGLVKEEKDHGCSLQ